MDRVGKFINPRLGMNPAVDSTVTEIQLIVGGYPVEQRLLTEAELAQMVTVGRWYSLRGSFGAVWVAKREGVVHIRVRCLSHYTLPTLKTMLTHKP